MNNIKNIIRDILKEFVLFETQKNPLVDVQLNNMLNKMELIDIPEGSDIKTIKQEIRDKVQSKLNKVQLLEYSFPDFHVIKLGTFMLKNGEKKQRMFFHMGDVVNEERRNAAFFYIYVYKDKIKILYYASEFYEDDRSLIENAKIFMKGNGINLDVKTEPGKIIIDNSLNSINEIDITNYGSHSAIASSKINPLLAKEKSAYVKGRPIKHPLFGRGIIQSVKLQGTDSEGNKQYYVTVKFSDKERTILMSSKKREPALAV